MPPIYIRSQQLFWCLKEILCYILKEEGLVKHCSQFKLSNLLKLPWTHLSVLNLLLAIG